MSNKVRIPYRTNSSHYHNVYLVFEIWASSHFIYFSFVCYTSSTLVFFFCASPAFFPLAPLSTLNSFLPRDSGTCSFLSLFTQLARSFVLCRSLQKGLPFQPPYIKVLLPYSSTFQAGKLHCSRHYNLKQGFLGFACTFITMHAL